MEAVCVRVARMRINHFPTHFAPALPNPQETDAASTRHAQQPADHSLPLRVFARPPLPTVGVCDTNVSG